MDSAAQVRIYINYGDQLIPSASKTDPALYAAAGRFLLSTSDDWFVATDIADFDGDGSLELYENRETFSICANTAGGPPLGPLFWRNCGHSKTVRQRKDEHQGFGLLKKIDNGRGASIEFNYTYSNNSQVVQNDDPAKYRIGGAIRIVEETIVNDDSSGTKSITNYIYKNPVKNKDRFGRYGFRGFEEVTIIGPANFQGVRSKTQEHYGYDIDPTGRLIGTTNYIECVDDEINAVASCVESTNETTWRRYELFNENPTWRRDDLSGKVIAYHPIERRSWTCDRASDREECKFNGTLLRQVYGWAPMFTPSPNTPFFNVSLSRTKSSFSVPPAAPGTCDTDQEPRPGFVAVMYVSCGSRITESSDHVIKGDRGTVSNYRLDYGSGTYRIFDIGHRRVVADANGTDLSWPNEAVSTIGRTEVLRNALGMPLETSIWHNEATVAVTTRTFTARGNTKTIQKPMQRDTIYATEFIYDEHEIYVEELINELGHRYRYRDYDALTGVTQVIEGPQQGSGDWPGQRLVFDGFGRPLESYRQIDVPNDKYEEVLVSRFEYYDAEIPTRVVAHQLIDFNGSVWITTSSSVDGLGRTLSTSNRSERGLSTNEYTYDDAGNLVTITVPNPKSDDAPKVKYQRRYDALGRIVSLEQPDMSGIKFEYAGLVSIHSECVLVEDQCQTDQPETAKTRLVYDTFGRLTQVQEFLDDDDVASTRYEYDPNNYLLRIWDAEGHATTMTNDWIGNRRQIQRDNRFWFYRYDENGNLSRKIAPRPRTADPERYSTWYEYDHLDRLKATTPDQNLREMSVDRLSELGIGQIRRIYDVGHNGVGRLTKVELPIGNVRYEYDSQGLVSFEQRSIILDAPLPIRETLSVRRQYNALGRVTHSKWNNGPEWRTTYDERGLVDRLEWLDPQNAEWTTVADYERSVAGLAERRKSSVGPIRTFDYDVVSRVLNDAIFLSEDDLDEEPISNRTYRYTRTGDLETVAGKTAGISASARYTYDKLHRVKTASGPNGYSGIFAYSATGNFDTADISWNGSRNDRHVRYVYGATDPQAADRLINVVDAGIYAEMAYDKSGNMIKRSVQEEEWQFVWDLDNQLREARKGASTRENYYYDHNGVRILAVENDQARIWFAETEMQIDDNGEERKHYLYLSE